MVKIDKVICDPQQVTENTKGAKTLLAPCVVTLYLRKDGVKHTYTFHFLEGFKCDGLSVPKLFQRWLPTWDVTNPTYNAAGMVHDFLYITKGLYGAFTREECDDTLRGIMRESGKSRFWASAADWCVGKFAGGSNHWGNDDYDSKFLAIVEVDP